MGLFRKSPRTAETAELDSLQAQLEALQRRIEITEVDQTHLGARIVALDDVTADLSARSTGHGTSTNGDPGTVNHAVDVEARFAELNAHVEQIIALGGQLDELGTLLAEIQQRADERYAALRAEVDELRSAAAIELEPRLNALDERLSATDATAAETATRLAALDERLTNVSTELANQIGELGGDIDAIANLPASNDEHEHDVVEIERIQALATGQTKLASEQARYEIAFREDLAALADQIRRSSGR
jgi:chromosome segregation ATPase